MGARSRLIASGLAVATALCAGAAVGRVVKPPGPAGATPPPDREAAAPGDAHAAHLAGAPADMQAVAGGTGAADGADGGGAEGLLASVGGYTFVTDAAVVDGASGTPFRFRITDPAGAVVHDFPLVHQRQLHLVLVARDLAVFHHLHPTLGPDGTWTVPLPALDPGAYRAIADFAVAGGPQLTLGRDLLVPGDAEYGSLPVPTGLLTVDGYDVSLTGAPALGEGSEGGDGGEVALTVARDGAPVTDLEPYLGEVGHLVVIRSSDLAFVHAHPVEAAPGTMGTAGGSGPTVRFPVAVSRPGAYRMFFEFAHAGVLHNAAFTADVPPPPP